MGAIFRSLLPTPSPADAAKKALTPSGSDKEFEDAVRRQVAFLFDRFGAVVVSNDYFPRAFGNAILVLETKGLRLRVVRDRDEVRLDIAPLHHPTEWVDSAFALASLENEFSTSGLRLDRTLSSIAEHLEPKLQLLQEAFSQERYQSTRQRVMEISEIQRRRAVQRLNAIK